MTTTREKTINAMRREWDTRARKDAFHYIASWRKDWDVSAFLKSGEEDYERLVAPVLERLGFSPDGKTMLELGCGAGRMTRSFAGRFGRVLASVPAPRYSRVGMSSGYKGTALILLALPANPWILSSAISSSNIFRNKISPATTSERYLGS